MTVAALRAGAGAGRQIALGQIDQRLLTIERVVLPVPPAPPAP